MTITSKLKNNGLNSLKADFFNDCDFLSESLMQKLVQREMARIVRTSEMLCIAAVCFEKLLFNSNQKIVEDNQVKQFFKSVEKLKKNVRESDIIGWIRNGTILGIVFTIENTASKEIVESKINEILEISLHNANNVNIEIDVTTWSADQNDKNGGKIEAVMQEYFKKKNQFINPD